jgi:hypothetical protein
VSAAKVTRHLMVLEEALTSTVNWGEDDETDAPYQLKYMTYDILKFACKGGRKFMKYHPGY